MLTDNGPQFAEEYAFTHITTSPRYPKANGEVKRPVQTVKHLLRKAQDLYRALMAYRAKLLESEQNCLREEKSALEFLPFQGSWDPSCHYLEQFREKDASLKASQKKNFDKRYFAKNLSNLFPGGRVCLPDQRVEGTVLDKVGTSRPFAVETHLNPLPEKSEAGNQGDNAVPDQATSSVKTTSPVQTPTLTAPRRTTLSDRAGDKTHRTI